MKFGVTIFGCHKYSDVAHSFFKVTCDANRELIKSSIFFTDQFIDDLNLKQHVESKNVEWSLRVAESLRTVNNDYILFLLDDYFITEKIDFDVLNELTAWCCRKDIKYCRLLNNPKVNNFGNMKRLDVGPYSINFQPSLWKREFLISILEKINANPWMAEISLNKHFDVIDYKYDKAVGFNIINNYLNAVIQGKWARDVPNCYIVSPKRKKMNFFEWWFYILKFNVAHSLSLKNKNLLKKILTKFGFNFYS